jgi:hypothetical protein
MTEVFLAAPPPDPGSAKWANNDISELFDHQRKRIEAARKLDKGEYCISAATR